EGDMAKLQNGVSAFDQRKAKIQEVLGQIKPETMKEYAGKTSFLKAAIGLGGAEGVAKVYQDHLMNLAFEDPETFAEVEKNFDALKSFKEGSYKDVDEELTAQYKALGLTETAFLKIMQIPDEEERTVALREEAKDALGWFWERPTGWRNKVRELAGRRDEMEQMNKALDDHSHKFGSILGLLVDKNETIRTAFNQELLGTRKKPEKLMSFSQMKGALPSREQVEKDRTAFRTEKGYDLNKDTFDPGNLAIDDQFASMFKQKQKGLQAGSGGIWKNVLLPMLFMLVAPPQNPKLRMPTP
ncbi:MAG: hypothetical protein AAB665_04210, partial [Patescibacteria group bacterium]